MCSNFLIDEIGSDLKKERISVDIIVKTTLF